MSRYRIKPASPYLVMGVGGVLLLTAVVHHATELYAIGDVVGPVVAVGLDGPPALGVVYAGYRLSRTDLSPDEQWLVCAWCLVGGSLFATIMGLSILVRALEGRVIGEVLFPLLIAAGTGSIAGVIAGYQTTRARSEARRAQTASEMLDERTRELQGVLDSVEAAIWIRDTDSRFRLVNQEFRTLFGIDPNADVAGRRLEEVLSSDVAAQFHEDDRQVLESKRAAEVEETVPTAQGERTLLTRISPLFDDDGVSATCGIASDITERKSYERTIEQQNERLEQFASVVSHDLRNPLNVADGRLQLAREECDNEHLEHVAGALDRMGALIEDLLTLARGGEAVTEYESVDLAALAEESWATVDTADATLLTPTDRAVYADDGRLKQVFENLIRNAVEHGSDDVSVTVGELNDGFYVEDDGPGIPTGERDAVFDAGYSTSRDGTGFGLNICERIVDAHDWAIRVADGTQGGARFEITGVEFADC